MNRYRGPRLIRTGLIGAVLVALIIAVGLQPQRILDWAGAVRYQATFAEAGGLIPGNDVKIAGVTVGSVSDVALEHGRAQVSFTVSGNVPLGSMTTAHIRTGTLLGERLLVLESDGESTMRPLEVIPLARTSSPYSLTEAVGDLTTNVAGTNTESLNQSLDTLAATIDQIAPQLGPTFDGLARLSQTVNRRNDTVTELLANTGTVTGILSDRSQQVNTLLLNANDLLDILVQRRQQIVQLINASSAVAQELSGLVADNEHELAPTLEKMNAVTEMLENNRDSIAKALPGLAKYQVTLGETVASGPFYTAFIPNLDLPPLLQPFLDYAFGFRRGVNAGQPPDDVGPRAEFPFPYNGIPEHPR
ncbi:mammalian cell entry protein [Mycolicibacterium chitae]|uniref:Virulence factor Mce family protein n=1 Tax=Mycolicibacterium chitae TaxID=1792 RepID=A0A448IDI1_MYCCI|nr:MCE family protein [Mycolicibacterium chitae]MCV7107567.1 MCE family protein [Mycolicibacterium chitae]BBZ01635.1 mammalian cell entry protein [Mycolicibacterium chitae]VEG50471.1 virulence factor Mce family protein [Mycolicibacterium chitae]